MSGYYVGVLKSLALAGRPVLVDLPINFTLSSNSSHVTCLIINYLCTAILEHAGSMWEHSFILCFPFILEVGPDVCPLSNIPFLPLSALWSTMQVCNLVHGHARLLYLALLLGKYK